MTENVSGCFFSEHSVLTINRKSHTRTAFARLPLRQLSFLLLLIYQFLQHFLPVLFEHLFTALYNQIYS